MRACARARFFFLSFFFALARFFGYWRGALVLLAMTAISSSLMAFSKVGKGGGGQGVAVSLFRPSSFSARAAATGRARQLWPAARALKLEEAQG